MSGYYQSPFLEQDLPTAFSTRPIPSPFNPSASRQDSALDAPGADVEPAQKSKTVSKKRRPSGNSQVKHRRTRNGCYTCRSRRVKCDEHHPICDRCRKGNRDCTYPEHHPAPKPAGATRDRSHPESPDSDCTASENEDEQSQQQPQRPSIGRRPALNDQPEAKESSPQTTRISSPRTASLMLDASRSPSTDLTSCQSSASFDQHPPSSSHSIEASFEGPPSCSHLSDDLQFYLTYHQSDVSYHHYFFKHDADHFLHVHLIEEALLFDPLLYAVVGFAAFQYRVKHGHGDSLEFLEYYNKSVSTLRQSLASGEPHKDGTMLTVLQLATFEEYMGDFVSLLSHQQAAFRMLLELYNTDSILESELRRKVLEWYLKFDITSSIMSGNETAASRGWFSSIADYYRGLTSQCPENIDYKIETAIGDHRLTCVDMTTMFARFSKGEITPEDFKIKCESFSQELNRWRDKLDPVFSDDRYRMWIFSNRSREENDIVDPFMAGGLYKGPLATFNFMTADWIAILAMFKYKKALLLGETLPPELPELALELCRIFEAIEYSPELPPEAVLKAQGILGVASLFLPKDERHTMWCRRKLAKIEALGHIYPCTYRRRMATLWDLPEINHWWLPNEEAYPSIARSVRSVLDNRDGIIDTRQRSQDQRDMRGIFSKLKIQDEG